MIQQKAFKTKSFELFINDQQLTLVGIDEGVLVAAIEYCDLERLSILSILNPGAAMIY